MCTTIKNETDLLVLNTDKANKVLNWNTRLSVKQATNLTIEWYKEFYKSKNSVSTASLAQVRQPIYKTSVAAWENYSSYLEDLKSSLKN